MEVFIEWLESLLEENAGQSARERLAAQRLQAATCTGLCRGLRQRAAACAGLAVQPRAKMAAAFVPLWAMPTSSTGLTRRWCWTE